MDNFLKGYSVLVRFLPEDLIVDEFFSTVPGKNFDLCIISTRTYLISYFYIMHIRCGMAAVIFYATLQVVSPKRISSQCD